MQPKPNRFPLVGIHHIIRGIVWQLAWAVVTGTTSLATTGTWNSSLQGNWSDASKWLGGVPNAPGDTANLTYDITGSRTISLTGDKTVGILNIGDPASTYAPFTINPGSPSTSKLIFDQSGTADATMTVPVAGGVAANVISSRILLKDHLAITAATPDKSTIQLAISSPIHDDGAGLGIAKNGQGIIRFSAPNLFSGGLAVNGGRVDANESQAFGSGPVSVANGGQVYLVGGSSGNSFTVSGTGYSNTADAAAQTGAIRIGNNYAVTGDIIVQSTGARIGVNGSDLGFLLGNLSGSGDLEINGPTTTTGGITLSGNGVNHTGTLQVARGDFTFTTSLGGKLTVSPASGFATTLVAGTSVAGDVTLDSSAGLVTFRNPKGPLAIGGNLNLAGTTRVMPANLPAPGTSTLTVMSYASKTGGGGFSFDATGYRGAPTISAGPNSAVIAGIDGKARTWSNGSGNANWSADSSLNWVEGDRLFRHADAVVFNDTALGTVNLVGTVTPHSVTFNSTGTNHRTIAGTGSIDGAGGGIIKNGTAWLTLGGANSFTGPVMVNAGRLIVGSTGGLGRTSGVHVAAGAVLDLGGRVTANDAWVAGSGDGVLPAITSSGGALRNVTLTGHASMGGANSTEFTIGSNGIIDGAGFTLTKVGYNEVRMMGTAKNLHTVVESGILSGWGTDPFGSSLRIKPYGLVILGKGGIYSTDLAIETLGGYIGHLRHDASTDSIWTGNITSDGSFQLSNNFSGASLMIAGELKVPGRLIIRPGGALFGGPIRLLGPADVGVSVFVQVYLALGNGGTGGSISSGVPIIMDDTYSKLEINRSDSFTMPNIISGDGGYVTKLGTGTLTLTASNSFGGSTEVIEGALLVNGNHFKPGSFLAKAGTILGGKGTVPGAVTINVGATLAPGDSIGTFTVGSTNLTTTINGTLSVEYDGSAPLPIDLLAANGPLTLGVSSALVFESAGSPLGGAVHVIATTTARSGTFANVTGLPTGYELAYSNTAIYLIHTDYKSWIAGHFPGITDLAIVGPGADPDGDELANMTENLLGTNPTAGNRGLEVVSTSMNSLTFHHSRADAAFQSFTGSYEWSPDLMNWNSPGETAGGVTVNLAASVWQDNPPPNSDIMQVVVSVTGGDASTIFVRHKTTSL